MMLDRRVGALQMRGASAAVSSEKKRSLREGRKRLEAWASICSLRENYSPQSNLSERSGGLSWCKLKEAITYINDNLDKNLKLTEIAAVVEISPYYFARLFKQSMGMPPHQYVSNRRIEQAKALLENTNLPIAEVASSVGFTSQSHFTNVFRKLTGITPKAYKHTPQKDNL
ncbi:MAG: hypothetical protein BRC40_01955 [Cyanobacteria bacterium QH_8_48_120]|nr:MAG: hypothetical protein BRC34_17340 [Cyanobacteria bacterium QH_1_48_107]PSO60025.1 MAG: hypothetical protein BRC35_02580 [Cyanobacteria bacterium QH_10_48_56]PSO62597.1 MAG: hypothetical protein BRC38_15385 [Cyanobacteria bacterium QH_6_48_35]PSO67986.1 MAG: hypothetical protein BRC39_00470 [Cyanobacteria bacterium QH_7_48_89]PSO77334.1 MAG: hypothetical protein BRC40_01955 [Cyanobacteria bacterium QH_8_48_120]PSO80781.1 MAG: hypothetical protein BRC41_16735 [Cyanobacteria bacterium QH_9